MLKASMGLFFYGLARSSRQRLIIVLPLATFLTYALAVALVMLFRCGIPIDTLRTITRDDCSVNWTVIGPLLYVFATLNALTDWIFAVLPIFLVFRARKLKPRSRHAVRWLVVLAIAGSAVSLIRIAFIHEYRFGPAAWKSGVGLSLLSSTESAIGTLAISLATMKPLMKPVRIFLRRLSAITIELQSDADGVKKNPKPRCSLSARADRNAVSLPALDTSVMRGIGVLSDVSTETGKEDCSDMQTSSTTTWTTFKSGATSSRRSSDNIVYHPNRGLVSILELDVEDAEHVPSEVRLREKV